MSQKPTYEELEHRVRYLENIEAYSKQYEKLLRQQVSEQKIMLNTIQEHVWYLSSIDAYGSSNLAHANFLGLKMEDIEHKKLREFLPYNVALVCEQSNREVFEKKETIHSEEWIPNAEGTNRLISISKTPKFDKDGNVEYIVCVGTDITERKNVEEALAFQRAQLKSLFDYSGEAIVLLDTENRVLDVNSGFEQIFGFSLKEARGKVIQDLICPERFHHESNELDRQTLKGIKGIELIRKRKNGEEIDVRASAGPIKVDDRVVGRFVVLDDISEQKKSERRLRDSEEKFRFLAEKTADIVWTVDLRLNTTYVSPSIEKVLGFTPEERKRQSLEQMLSTESLQRAITEFTKALKREEDGDIVPDQCVMIELEYYRKDGSTVWMENSMIPMRDHNSDLVGIYGVSRDIAERKQAELALRKSEEKYRTLVDQSLQGIAIAVGPQPRLLFANSSMARIWGYTVSELLEMSPQAVYELIHPDDREWFFVRFKERLAGKHPPTRYEARGITRDNKTIWVEVSSNCINYLGEPAVQAVFTDITERKQALKRMEESESKLRTIIEHSNEMFYIHDAEHTFTYVSPTSEEILGYAPEELKRKWTELVTDNPLNRRGVEIMEEAFRTGEKQAPYLLMLERKDGNCVLLEIDESPVKDPNGRVVAVAGAARDVSSQKEVEKKLKKSEQRFRDLFAAISDIIYTQDLDGRFLSLNPALCKLFGYDEAELIGRKASEFMKPELFKAFETEYLERIKKEGKLEGISVYLTKEGKKIYLEYRSSMVFPEEGEPYISGTGRDVTARIVSEKEVAKLHAHLSQVQKMESIGTLAGGIAHNFNNVLMGIQGRASLMMMDKDSSHPDFEHLKGIEEYVRSAAELTRDLLGFARGGKYEVKPTNLNVLIKHENRMFGRTKKEIRIHGNYGKDLWPVEVDQGQMQQVFLNLYVNAWQAMPGGGDLYVQTENVTLDKKHIRPFDIAPGRFVKVSVADTGFGMNDTTLEKIFDPFFSTKDTGQGSGLGLASVYGIIKNHGGFIEVSSAEREGTKFDIYLPASKNDALRERLGSGRSEIRYGRGTILLVDDEDMILEVGRMMLKKLGYQVLVAGSGEEALDMYGSQKEEIDLVILDMIMPGMGGGETYDRLKELDGDVRVLLSSGYSIDGQAKEIMDRGCKGFIQKPFAMEELSRRVKGVLPANSD